MKIRPAELGDYPQLMKLYNLFVGDNRYREEADDNFRVVMTNDNSHIWVCEDGAQLVAFLSFSVRPVVRYPKRIAEIDELFVSESHRRHGIAGQLMEKLETWCEEQGIHRVYIESAYKHEVAHKFYEKLGYINYGYHFYKSIS